jgi:large conductance mechanosensitive channel
MRGIINGFKEFILRGNVIDLAVAVVVGAAFTQIVNSLVSDLITPLLGAFGGIPDFSGLTFTINNSIFRYGSFINALIAFLITAAVLYAFVVQPVNLLMSRLSPLKAEIKPAICPHCFSEISQDASRCPNCTSWLKGEHAPVA